MLKIIPELTKRQLFENETIDRWKSYGLSPKLNIPIPKGKRYIDIGCGSHAWEKVKQEFWALDCVKKELPVRFIEECFPHTTLPDSYFDVVFCIDLIAELPKNLYRLAMSELSRILKPEGKLVISTELDLRTKEPARYFCDLIRCEFEIVESFPKYRFFWEKLLFPQKCYHLTLITKKKELLRFD